MANKLLVALCIVPIFAMTGCVIWTHADGKRLFAEQRDAAIARKHNIEGYLNPRSAVALRGVQEVRSGVLEYSFEEKKAKLFRPAEEKCRFIVAADKATGTMIGWRYNSNPEFCTANP